MAPTSRTTSLPATLPMPLPSPREALRPTGPATTDPTTTGSGPDRPARSTAAGTTRTPTAGAPMAGTPTRAPVRSEHPTTLPLVAPTAVTAAIGPAWIVREVTHVPGILRLEDGRLSFVSTRGVLFDVAVDETPDLAFPWYRLSGAFRLTVAGERLRVHVTRPAGAVPPSSELVEQLVAASGLPATRGDAGAGAVWRWLLERPVAMSTGRVQRARPPGVTTPGWRSARARRGFAGPAPRS